MLPKCFLFGSSNQRITVETDGIPFSLEIERSERPLAILSQMSRANFSVYLVGRPTFFFFAVIF